MGYNWEEIFKKKSNEELYKIYSGDSYLPNETIPFAKKELEKRNFNFDSVHASKLGWKLKDLLITQDDEVIDSSLSNELCISFGLYLIIITAVTILCLILVKYTFLGDFGINILLAISLPLATIAVLIHNYLYKRKKLIRERRQREINDISNHLKDTFVLDYEDPIYNDIKKERNRNRIVLRRISYIAVILFILTILVIILVSLYGKK